MSEWPFHALQQSTNSIEKKTKTETEMEMEIEIETEIEMKTLHFYIKKIIIWMIRLIGVHPRNVKNANVICKLY